jgi:uncharacterized membrane protein YccF (DUF307 family)
MNDLSAGPTRTATQPVTIQSRGPGCLVQVLWFVFVGWWLGAAWVTTAWFLMALIITAPIGASMLNNVPQVMALRGKRTIEVRGGRLYEQRQQEFLIRALWFIFVGWWASAIWVLLAYSACMTLFLMPVGFWMFDKTPWVVSLRR